MKRLIAALMGWLVMQSAYAVNPGVEFSAIAVQATPGQADRIAMMFVTPKRVRMEYESQGKRFVEITDIDAGRSFLLLPNQRVFAVKQAPKHVTQQTRQAKMPMNPCINKAKASCKKLGNETLHNRPTEKWEMLVEHKGKSYRSLYWIDVERFMPLRQQWADGSSSEMRPKGDEELNGRQTEKWEVTTKGAKGNVTTSMQWYDTALKMTIREDIAGGFRRELREILQGPLPITLFQVPAGFRQVEISQIEPAKLGQGRIPAR